MSKKIRIATYNCENLFSRTKIFGENEGKSLKLLAAVALLQQELKKPVFDQEKLAKLPATACTFSSILLPKSQ